MKIRNIIWKFDAVLFDTYPAMTYAISKSLTEFGFSMALNEIDNLIRGSVDYCLETLSQRFRLDQALLSYKFQESYKAVFPGNQPPLPGVEQICSMICDQGGQNLIITDHASESVHGLLRAHALEIFFTDILIVQQTYPRKPDPGIMRAALQKYALKTEETILISDIAIDIEAGKEVGIQTCLFRKGPLTTQADLQIENYSQLLDLLNN